MARRPGGRFIYALQFERMTAYPQAGYDEAYIYDSTGDDTFWESLADAVLSDGTLDLLTGDLLAAGNYYCRLTGFDDAVNDLVRVYGSSNPGDGRKIIPPVYYDLAFTGTWLDL